jgi:hypothetical protein
VTDSIDVALDTRPDAGLSNRLSQSISDGLILLSSCFSLCGKGFHFIGASISGVVISFR